MYSDFFLNDLALVFKALKLFLEMFINVVQATESIALVHPVNDCFYVFIYFEAKRVVTTLCYKTGFFYHVTITCNTSCKSTQLKVSTTNKF